MGSVGRPAQVLQTSHLVAPIKIQRNCDFWWAHEDFRRSIVDRGQHRKPVICGKPAWQNDTRWCPGRGGLGCAEVRVARNVACAHIPAPLKSIQAGSIFQEDLRRVIRPGAGKCDLGAVRRPGRIRVVPLKAGHFRNSRPIGIDHPEIQAQFIAKVIRPTGCHIEQPGAIWRPIWLGFLTGIECELARVCPVGVHGPDLQNFVGSIAHEGDFGAPPENDRNRRIRWNRCLSRGLRGLDRVGGSWHGGVGRYRRCGIRRFSDNRGHRFGRFRFCALAAPKESAAPKE